jgi:signal peptidase I
MQFVNRLPVAIVSLITVFALASTTRYLFDKNFLLVRNISPSEPMGFYLVVRTNDIHKGDLILFKFNKQSEFVKQGTFLLKEVVCVPGDTLIVKGRNFFCNGKLIAEALSYSCKKHIPVEPFSFNGVIPQGEYFVLGKTKCSYDSRYWGFVKKEDILGKAFYLGF